MKSESNVKTQAQLNASQAGWRLWRNNVGVAFDKTGRPIRYGLCNESKRMNESIKSSDLIGVRPVLITPEMVGTTIGQFVAMECKHPGWQYAGTAREIAQKKFLDVVTSLGGYGTFVTSGEGLHQ